MRVCDRERGPRATGGSLRAGARGVGRRARRRGAARATLFIKEPRYAAVATVAAPATGKLPALVIYLKTSGGRWRRSFETHFSAALSCITETLSKRCL